MNLYLFNENISNGFNSFTLMFISIAAILCGIFVIVSKNPIVSVLFLIGLFLTISMYLMMLGINFIGLSYLLVYVGAVSILFLFILMLINIRVSEIITTTSNSIPLAIIIGSLFYSTVYQTLPLKVYSGKTENINFNTLYTPITDTILNYLYSVYDFFKLNTISQAVSQSSSTSTSPSLNSKYYDYKDQCLELISSKGWDSMLAENSHITTIGNILYTSYPMWILLTSLILLLAMVGAILITLKN